jgi:TolB-like protein
MRTRTRARERGRYPQKAPLPLPDKPSIAVLPFQNMSGDPEQEYFADGMVEEIIAALSRIRWLFVIARNSTFTYKGRAVDVKQVSRELGVRYVLEGSVRRNKSSMGCNPRSPVRVNWSSSSKRASGAVPKLSLPASGRTPRRCSKRSPPAPRRFRVPLPSMSTSAPRPSCVSHAAPPRSLSRPDFHYAGNMGRTYLDFDPPQFAQPVQAPKGAPE